MVSMANVKIDQLAETLATQLGKWSKDVEQDVKKAVDDTMKTLVANTKRDAPVKTGDYKNAISSKVTQNKGGEYQKTWYVKAPHYRLTHVLEKGHAKRGGGRVQPREHIGKNAEIARQEFENKVKEAIKNA